MILIGYYESPYVRRVAITMLLYGMTREPAQALALWQDDDAGGCQHGGCDRFDPPRHGHLAPAGRYANLDALIERAATLNAFRQMSIFRAP